MQQNDTTSNKGLLFGDDYHYPKYDTIQLWAKAPSQELSNALVEQFQRLYSKPTIESRCNMASSKEYLTFVLEQLSGLEGVTYRAMMGEYILYFRNKIVGGIYDNRLLVKPVPSAIALMPTVTYELPYEVAKEMLLVDDVDNKEFLCNLFLSMYDELPAPKKKKNDS